MFGAVKQQHNEQVMNTALRFVLFAVFLCCSVGVLIALGTWQIQRLHWKNDILTTMQRRLDSPAAAVPPANVIEPQQHGYQPVVVQGEILQEVVYVLSTQDGHIGYRVITPLVFNNRRILVDLGFIANNAQPIQTTPTTAKIIGHVHWPDETDIWTPPPDTNNAIWFARDVAALAQHFQTEPILLIATSIDTKGGVPITPVPLTTDGIRNAHFGYALTWYSMAVIWAVMGGFMLYRMQQSQRHNSRHHPPMSS